MTPKKLNRPFIFAATVFVLCLGLGHELSLRRPLWNDEIYSQTVVIDPKSYSDFIFSGIGKLEGNSCPLFYIIQNGISDLFQYRFPIPWEREWSVAEEGSQVIMRLSSNFFMSLSIALLVYFFARYYSFGAGIYVLLVSLSSFIVWAYWAEARPYTLWFFLTTSQLLIYLALLREEYKSVLLWRWLAVVHVLLALTLILSGIQIALVSFLLWFYKRKEYPKEFIYTVVIPLGICLLYYSNSSLYKYSLAHPFQLIFRNISPEQIMIFLIYFIFLLIGGRKTPALKEARQYSFLLLLMLPAALAFLLLMSFRTNPEYSDLSERYFIYLAPAGIIAVVLFSVDLFRAYRKNLWMLTNVSIVLGGLLILQFFRTYKAIFGI